MVAGETGAVEGSMVGTLEGDTRHRARGHFPGPSQQHRLLSTGAPLKGPLRLGNPEFCA